MKGRKEGAILRVRGRAFQVDVYSVYVGTCMGPMARGSYYIFYLMQRKAKVCWVEGRWARERGPP